MMTRTGWTAMAVVALTATLAPAQEPAKFRWQTGQVLVYKVEQNTIATEGIGETKVEARTGMKLTKRWQVKSVSAAGVATLELSLLALQYESRNPGVDPLVFDSTAPDKSSKELKDQLGKFVNAPLATLLIDSQGKVIEVKESKFGPGSRFENELPFVGVVPNVAMAAGVKWERNYQITPELPGKTAEKVPAIQRYVCKGVAGTLATVTIATELPSPPKTPADLIPLLGVQPTGEMIFDLKTGRMQSAVMKVDKEVKDFPAEGGVYHYQSSYSEQFVEDR